MAASLPRSPALAQAEVLAGNAQERGKRDAQEDAYGFSSFADQALRAHGGVAAVLADGMGGMHNGVWSSVHAVRSFLEQYAAKSPQESVSAALERALRHANQCVYAEAVRLGLLDRMGTTLVAAVVHNQKGYWVSVGDSRVYLYSRNQLRLLSRDQSYGEVLRNKVLSGEITQQEADNHPMRNALIGYLGRKPEDLQVDGGTIAQPLEPGDWLMLCSDGISGVLNEVEIEACLTGDANEAAQRLVRAAINRGLRNQDNATVTLLQVGRSAQAVAHGSHSVAIYPQQKHRGAQAMHRWWRPKVAMAAGLSAMAIVGLSAGMFWAGTRSARSSLTDAATEQTQSRVEVPIQPVASDSVSQPVSPLPLPGGNVGIGIPRPVAPAAPVEAPTARPALPKPAAPPAAKPVAPAAAKLNASAGQGKSTVSSPPAAAPTRPPVETSSAAEGSKGGASPPDRVGLEGASNAQPPAGGSQAPVASPEATNPASKPTEAASK